MPEKSDGRTPDVLYRVGGAHIREDEAEAKKLSAELKKAGEAHDVVPEPVLVPQTTYAVHSAITGAHVCGPYDSEDDAQRECDRLNLEAQTGVQAHYEGQSDHNRIINGHRGAPGAGPPLIPQPIKQSGHQMEYELVTGSGVIL